MFAIGAFILFVIAGVLQGSGSHTGAWLSPFAFVCYGLACLALHVSGRVRS